MSMIMILTRFITINILVVLKSLIKKMILWCLVMKIQSIMLMMMALSIEV